MAKTLRDVIAGLPAAERATFDARAAALIKEEMSLQDLGEATRKTKVVVAINTAGPVTAISSPAWTWNYC